MWQESVWPYQPEECRSSEPIFPGWGYKGSNEMGQNYSIQKLPLCTFWWSLFVLTATGTLLCLNYTGGHFSKQWQAHYKHCLTLSPFSPQCKAAWGRPSLCWGLAGCQHPPACNNKPGCQHQPSALFSLLELITWTAYHFSVSCKISLLFISLCLLLVTIALVSA